MCTLDEGSGLDVEGVVAGSFLSNCISTGGWEGVESGFGNGSSDFSIAVAVESLGETSVVPDDGGFSSFMSKLEWDLVVDSVDPAVEGGGHDQLNNFFVLLGWAGGVGTGGHAQELFLLTGVFAIGVGDGESEGAGDVGGSWDHSAGWAGEEGGEVAEGEFSSGHAPDSVPGFVVLLSESGGEVGRGKEELVAGDQGGQQANCEKIFEHDLFILTAIIVWIKLIQRSPYFHNNLLTCPQMSVPALETTGSGEIEGIGFF